MLVNPLIVAVDAGAPVPGLYWKSRYPGVPLRAAVSAVIAKLTVAPAGRGDLRQAVECDQAEDAGRGQEESIASQGRLSFQSR